MDYKDIKEIGITVLTGYLGSGKTTLINHILNNQEGFKVAVIVNDIGEVNIDASLIGKDGVVNQKDDNLVPLSNGCICCTLKVDLMNQIAELAATKKFDYILVEASGICEPLPIAQTITVLENEAEKNGLPKFCRLDNIVTVVDALRMRDEFNSGNDLNRNDLDEEDIENLLIQQIEFCNVIVLNKAHEVTEKELDEVKKVIRALQPKAEIIETDYSKVEISKLIDTRNFDFEKVAMSSTWAEELNKDNDDLEEEHHHHHDHDHEHDEDCDCEECKHEHEEGHHHHHHHHDHCHCHNDEEGEAEEYGIGTFVYYRRKPLDRDKFEEFANTMTRNIIRSKGVIWFSDENDMSYVFETSGKQIQLSQGGQWIATMPEEQLKMFLESSEELRKDWKEDCGDRMIKLVFIGKKMDKELITKKLDMCLVD